jgi:hypothetical protein
MDIRDYIKLVEAGYAETEYGAKMSAILAKAREVQREVAALNVAPSVQEKLDAALKLVTGYLHNLAVHAGGRPGRQKAVPGLADPTSEFVRARREKWRNQMG